MTATLIDWDALPDAEPVTDLPPAPESKPDKTPDAPKGYCQGCGEFIERPEGARGRTPKYHPDCKPTTSGTGRATTSSRNSKASREADEAIAALRSHVLRGVVMASAFDQYSAFVILVSLPSFFESLHGVLVRYDGFRREMLAVKSGGSILGLILSGLSMALPIAARFGLIPSRTVSQVLLNMPYTLHAINQKLKDGEATLATLIETQMREREETMKNAKKAAQNADQNRANAYS